MSYISFLHQTTTAHNNHEAATHCLISLFYIKPQRWFTWYFSCRIVLYLFSTSNHNALSQRVDPYTLSYISFLHQTTTVFEYFETPDQLSYISFLHQTTTKPPKVKDEQNCLISLFYIKPQRQGYFVLFVHIVLYLFSTSNHNVPRGLSCSRQIVLYLFSTSNHNFLFLVYLTFKLSYISFLHQTTTFQDVLIFKK